MVKNLIEVEIIDEAVISFLSCPIISKAFSVGGWIAGGFPRIISKFVILEHPLAEKAHHEILNDYIFSYINKGGDVDFFFSNEKSVSNALSSDTHYHRSAFANNMWTTSPFEHAYLKIQLVNKFFYADVKESFNNFDFLNSCYAIQKREGKFYLIYDEEALSADIKKELVIKNSNSPYTLPRVFKYLNSRNLEKISGESIDILVDLLIKSASDIFDSRYSFNLFKPYLENSIKNIFELGIVEPEEAIYFLGRFKNVRHEPYGPTYVTDWASDVIASSVNP